MDNNQLNAELAYIIENRCVELPILKVVKAAQTRIAEQDAQIRRLSKAIEAQRNAVETLRKTDALQISLLRKDHFEAQNAIASLDSEKEMNSTLTQELEIATTRIAKLEARKVELLSVLNEVIDHYQEVALKITPQNIHNEVMSIFNKYRVIAKGEKNEQVL